MDSLQRRSSPSGEVFRAAICSQPQGAPEKFIVFLTLQEWVNNRWYIIDGNFNICKHMFQVWHCINLIRNSWVKIIMIVSFIGMLLISVMIIKCIMSQNGSDTAATGHGHVVG